MRVLLVGAGLVLGFVIGAYVWPGPEVVYREPVPVPVFKPAVEGIM